MRIQKLLTTQWTVMISPFLLVGCVIDTFDTKLKTINKTADTIYVTLSETSFYKHHPIEIDSTNGNILWDYMLWINPLDSSFHIPRTLGGWENYINEKCQDSTLTVFLFDETLLKSVPRDSLIARQLYSKKFSYKVKDLEKMKWRIVYNN
jgi:hypothetical protein